MAYAIMQTDTATTRGSASGSVWTIVAFFVAFVGGTLVTVGGPGARRAEDARRLGRDTETDKQTAERTK